MKVFGHANYIPILTQRFGHSGKNTLIFGNIFFRVKHACGYYRYTGDAVSQECWRRGWNFKRHAEVARESTVSSNVAAGRITCRVHCVLLSRQPFAGRRPCD